MGIQFGPSEPEGQITFEELNQAPPLPEDVASERAVKWHVGMGTDSPGPGQIQAGLEQGTDRNLRNYYAGKLTLQDQQHKLAVIEQIAKMKGGALDQNELDVILGMRTTDNRDPQTVMEESYATALTNQLAMSQGGDKTMAPLGRVNPDSVLNTLGVGQDIITKKEYAQKKAEELAARFSNQGVVSKVWQFGKQMLLPDFIPGSAGFNTHDVSGMPTDTIWPGKNLAQQIQGHYIQNVPGFKATLDNTLETLWGKNPADAMAFAHAMVEFGTSDQLMTDINAGATVAGFMPWSKAGKLFKAADTGARLLTTAELTKMQQASTFLGAISHAASTIGTPRSLTAAELVQMRTAAADIAGPVTTTFHHPYDVTKFVPRSQLEQMGQNLKDYLGIVEYSGAARDLNPVELKQAQEGASRLFDIAANTSDPRPMSLQELERARMWGNRDITPEEISLMRGSMDSVAKTVTDFVKSTKGKLEADRVAAGAGDASTAGKVTALKAVKALVGDEPFDVKKFIGNVLNPDRGVGYLGAELATRLVDRWSKNASQLSAALINTPKFDRTSEAALAKAFVNTEQEIKEWYPRLSIISSKLNYGLDPKSPANVNSVSVLLGKKDATLFETYDQARVHADMSGLPRANIRQQGAGWGIETSKTIDETKVRDLLIQTETKTPVTMSNMLMRYLKGSKNVMSPANNEARNLVTHGSQQMQNLMKSVAQDVGKLSKDEYARMMDFFQKDRDFSPGLGAKPGRYFDSAADFGAEFLKMHGVAPTEKEVRAYYSVRQLNDFDWLQRSLGLYRDMSRQGVENISFKFTPVDSSSKVKVPFFYGKKIDKLPTNAAANVLFHDADADTLKLYRLDPHSSEPLPAAVRTNMQDKLDNKGYHVIQVWNSVEKPLAEATGKSDFINFVVARDVSRKPLDIDKLIPYAPGGHRDYGVKWFTKQPIINDIGKRINYSGDGVVFGHESEAAARKYTTALETARQLFNDKKVAEFFTHVERNLPYTGEQALQKFNSGVWDAKQPFKVTFTGQSTLDAHPDIAAAYGQKFHDEYNSPHNLSAGVDRKFLASRDPELLTIKNLGNEEKPQYTLAPARLIDPMTTMNRAVSNVISQKLLGDYKALTVETFIKQFGHLMDVDPQRLWQTPLHYLENPRWKDQTLVNSLELGSAKAARMAALNYMGVEAPDVSAVKYFQQKMLNVVFDKIGQKASDYISESMVSDTVDPFRHVRNLAFFSKMGFFNMPQFLNQAQTLVNIHAIAGPVNGWAGSTAGMLSMYARNSDNPSLIKYLASVSEKSGSGWKAQDWEEAFQGMRRSGWNLVQGETGWRNDVSDPKLIRGAWGKFLDAGTLFFTEGERLTREVAWFTAYREWKTKNPETVLGDKGIGKILERSNLLTADMTNAGMAPWQGGGFGGSKITQLMAQFMPYQIRLAEQLYGSRLTKTEKIRMAATYTAMYGVPASLGIAIPLWPMYDQIRQSSLDRGINWDGSQVEMLMEGIPSYLISHITGKHTNFSERYGPQGISTMKDVFDGEKTWKDAILGVAGSTMNDFVKAASPIGHALISALGGTNEKFPFMIQDALEAAKPISSVNNTTRAIWAWNFLTYINKMGVPIAGADKVDAVLTGAFGLTRRDISDAYRMLNSTKDLKESKDKLRPYIERELRNALEASASDDATAVQTHMTRARHYMAWGGFYPDETTKMIQDIGRFGSLVDNAKWEHFMNSPPDQRKVRQDMYFKKGE